jgi:hypothetical protein
MRSPPLDLITQLAVRKAVNLYFNEHTLVSLRHTPGNGEISPLARMKSLSGSHFSFPGVSQMSNGAQCILSVCVNECIIFAHTHTRRFSQVFTWFHRDSHGDARRTHTHVHFQCFNPIVCVWLVSAQRLGVGNAAKKQTESHSAHAAWEWNGKSPFLTLALAFLSVVCKYIRLFVIRSSLSLLVCKARNRPSAHVSLFRVYTTRALSLLERLIKNYIISKRWNQVERRARAPTGRC